MHTEYNFDFIDAYNKCLLIKNVSVVIEGSIFKGIMEDTIIESSQKLNFMQFCKVFYLCDPYHKAQIVQAYQLKLARQQNMGTVGYIGDGLNDSHAQKVADVSFGISNKEDIHYTTFYFEDEIDSLTEIVQEGKQCQELQIQLFKWALVCSTFDLFGVFFIQMNLLNVSDVDFIVVNLLLFIPVAFLIGRSRSREKINPFRPLNSLFSMKIVLPYFLYLCLIICTSLMFNHFYTSQEFYKTKD